MPQDTNNDANYLHNGRVNYVEPNWTRELHNKDGDLVDAPHDPEDLCVSVDLQVEVKSRSGGSGENAETIYLMTWTNGGAGSRLSFFQGTSLPVKDGKKGGPGSLTTSYADIHFNDVRGGEFVEGLGITSIDISFESWYTPVVVIKFSDVRGASLFAPEEYAHRMDNGEVIGDTAGSFFKCFFSFPYPRFTLFVKGFYGEGVSYQLMCSDFRSSFNSDNGNFESEATFLGYTYSLLTDVPMSLVRVAPYNEYNGAEYWAKNSVVGGRFSVGDDSTSVPMPTLTELCDMVQDAPQRIAAKAATAPIVRSRNYYQAQLTRLAAIRNAFDAYYRTFFDRSRGDIVIEPLAAEKKGKLLILCAPSVDNAGYVNNSKERRELIEKINEFNSSNPGAFTVKFSDGRDPDNPAFLKTYKTFEILEPEAGRLFASVRLDTEAANPDSIRVLLNADMTTLNEAGKNAGYDNYLMDRIRDYVTAEGAVSSRTNELGKNVYSTVYDFGGLFEAIEKKINDYNNDIGKTDAEFNKWQENAVKDVFGFKPSIRNIMRIIFAHVETLLHSVYSCRETINGDTGRTMAALGLTSDNSDVSGISGQNKVPPFPRYMAKSKPSKDNKNPTPGAEDVFEDAWIGRLSPMHPMEEEKLINGMVVATQRVGDLISVLRAKISTSDDFLSANFIPTLLTDITFGGPAGTNPYCYAGNDLLSVFMFASLRMLNYLDQYSRTEREKMNIVLVARCEALNYYKAHGNNSSEFLALLDNLNADMILSMMAGTNRTWDEVDSRGNTAASITLPGDRRAVFSGSNGYRYIEDGYQREILPTSPISVADIRNTFFQGNGVRIPTGDTLPYYTPTPVYNAEAGSGASLNANAVAILENVQELQTMRTTILNNRIEETEDLSHLVSLWDVGYDNFASYYLDNNLTTRIVPYVRGASDFAEDTMLPVNRSMWRDWEAKEELLDSERSAEYCSIDNYGTNPINSESMYRPSSKMSESVTSVVNGQTPPAYYTVSYIPAVMPGTGTGSLHGIPFYYMQNSIADMETRTLVKALLFLQTTPAYINAFLDKFVNGEPGVFTVPMATVLLAGGYLWRERYIQEHNKDCYVFVDDTDPRTHHYESLARMAGTLQESVSRCLRHEDGSMARMTDLFTGNGNNGGSYFEVGHEDVSSTNYARIHDKLFALDYQYKNTLIDYFVEWATTVYAGWNRKLELYHYDENGVPRSYNGSEFASFARRVYGAQRQLPQDHGRAVAGELYEGLSLENFASYQRVYSSAMGVSLILVLRQDGNLAAEIRDFLCRGVAFYSRRPVKMTAGRLWHDVENQTYGVLTYNESDARLYMKEFLGKLKDLYANKIADQEKAESASDTPEGKMNEDLKISLYRYIKELNDRWLCSNGFTSYQLENFFDRYFIFIDTFFRDIGDELVVNMDYLAESFANLGDDRNLFSFVADLLARHGMNFIAQPNFNDWAEPTTLKRMFTPVPYARSGRPSGESFFICNFVHVPSRNLDLTTGNSAYQFQPDSMNIDGRTPLPAVLSDAARLGQQSPDGSDREQIPAFGVVFARQNQSYFKKITVGMENPVATEYSIKAYFAMADQAREGNRSVSFTGQDLYSVWSNNSYTCTIEMLGCAQILPLMYFQLLNVPMFRGAYQVIKVKHNIRPGYMTTTVTGVRMSRIALPINVEPFNMVSLMNKLTTDAVNYGYASTAPVNGTISPTGGVGYSTGPVTNIPSYMPANGLVEPEKQQILPVSARTSDEYLGLKYHMVQLFESLRATIKAQGLPFDIVLTSGRRSEGRSTSDHYQGDAMDIKIKGKDGGSCDSEYLGTVFDLIVTYYMPYVRQLIWESRNIGDTTEYYPTNCIHWASMGVKVEKVGWDRTKAIAATQEYDDYYRQYEYGNLLVAGTTDWSTMHNDKRQVFQQATPESGRICGVNSSRTYSYEQVPFSKAFLKVMAKRYVDNPEFTNPQDIREECTSMEGIDDPVEFLRPFLNA